MYATEKMFEEMSNKELYATLDSIQDNDYYTEDFSNNIVLRDFLYMLELYNLVFVTFDKRILLTRLGEKTLVQLNQTLI